MKWNLDHQKFTLLETTVFQISLNQTILVCEKGSFAQPLELSRLMNCVGASFELQSPNIEDKP